MLSPIKLLVRPSRICWICGKSVSLENCKIDEHGSAVHEECYVAKVALAKAPLQARRAHPTRVA